MIESEVKQLSKQDTASDKDALLLNVDVQAMVQKMVDRGIYSISSVLERGGIVYPILKELFPIKSEKEVSDFLDELTRAGILKSRLVDKVILCPTCGSPSVYSKYNCPRCSSFDIGKAVIIEHIRCGFIGSKDKFQTKDVLICPKCKNIVTENDYRKIGTSFECKSCGSRFESPRMSHKCNSCDDVFTYKEARYEPLYEFELSEETRRTVARGTLPLASIIATMKESGFDIGSRRDILGKSGAMHTFDIVAKKRDVVVVANFAFEPKEEDIIALFAKKYDVDPTITLLIALTPPTKEEETVSKAYGVKIISPVATSSIGKQIVELADSMPKENNSDRARKEVVIESILDPRDQEEINPKREEAKTSKTPESKQEKTDAADDSKTERRKRKDENFLEDTQSYTSNPETDEEEGRETMDAEQDPRNTDRNNWDSESF